MQAVRQTQSIPTRAITVLLALAALVAGGAVGYTLKPASEIVRTQFVVSSGDQGLTDPGCINVARTRAC